MNTGNSTDDVFEGKSSGKLLADGLEDVAETLKTNKKAIPEKLTCRRIALDLDVTPYNPALVKSTRALLGASQAVFARFLGVSYNAVRAWERGMNSPRDAACRLMDEIRHDPEYWQTRIREIAIEKVRRGPLSPLH